MIIVNGKRINVPNGHSVSIINGDVIVDGKSYTDNKDLKEINIVIEGDCGSLKVDSCNRVEVGRDVAGDIRAGGSVVVHGAVQKNIDAGGSVTCANVGGDVDAGGSVTCGNISGSVDAGGSVIHR